MVQAAPPAKRNYLTNVRSTIVKAAARSPMPRLWIYALRDDRSVLLTWPES